MFASSPGSSVNPRTNIEVAIPEFTGDKSEYKLVLMDIDFAIAYLIYQKACQ